MRCNVRLFVVISVIFLLSLLYLYSQYRDNVRAFLLHSSSATANPSNHQSTADDKIIVMAKLSSENTDWVAANLPDWQRAIYTVNPSASTSSKTLTTPKNKGHESLAYLTYIVENYNSLPSTLAFIHPHRGGHLHYWSSWHTDAPAWDNVASLRDLRLDTVQIEGYVNLRCNWQPGCRLEHRRNKHITPEIWGQLFPNGTGGEHSDRRELNKHNEQSKPSQPSQPSRSKSHSTPQEPNTIMPTEIGSACCAQFAVSKTQVLKRPLGDYIRYRDWVLNTNLSDAKSGRVMEFLWHVIFGREAVL